MTETKPITYAWAINHAIDEEMQRDPTVFLLGQDVGRMGGVFGLTRGLFDKYGAERVRDVSIVEHLVVGGAVGAAMGGMRPIAEVQFADFLLLAGDESFHKMAKWRYMHGGRLTVPMVVRAPCGIQGGVGAEHSQSPEGHYWHTPGVKIAVPSNPADAKGLLKSAIRDDNPVIYFENRRLYRDKGIVSPDPDLLVPFGQGTVAREGADVTIVAWSAMVPAALEAAEILEREEISVEVVDPRTLVPFDMETVAASVRKTSRLLVLHEASLTAGPGAEIAARAADELFELLDAPVKRLAGADNPIPQNMALEPFCYPQTDEIVSTVRDLAKW